MQVIDVVERQERVQRRVDRRGDAVLAERAQRIERDHLVFVRLAAVARDQLFELVEIQDGEAGRADRSQVAAAALDRQHAHRLAGQRIRQRELRAGVAAAEVGDPQIGAEQVRSVAQQLERIRSPASPPRASSQRFFRNALSTVDAVSDTGELHVLLKPVVVRRPSDRRRAARTARPGTIDRCTARASASEPTAPVAIICSAMLPSAVASTGPAITVRPVASAVHCFSSRLREPPPTIRISSKRRPVSSSSDSSTARYLNARLSRIARA